MENQIRPIRPSEAAGTSWIVAGLLALFGFVVLSNTGWTFLQAIFAAGVVFVVMGILISQTVGRIKPLSTYAGRTPTRPVETEDGVALGVDLSALRPRDLTKPSPHRDTPTPSILSDGKFKKAVEPDHSQPIQGTVEPTQVGPVASPAPDVAPEPDAAAGTGAAPAFGVTAETEGKKPAALDAPREGGADDLQKIRGVGPKLAEMLHGMGFYHFDQIANWSDEEVAWVDQNIEGFPGRVTRDEWRSQARALAEGRTPE